MRRSTASSESSEARAIPASISRRSPASPRRPPDIAAAYPTDSRRSGPGGSRAERVFRPMGRPVEPSTMSSTGLTGAGPREKELVMDRKSWDQIVSGAGAVVAVVLIVLGAMAIYGGRFGRDNVRDRLEPQNISFPPADTMSPEEKAEVGEFAGQKVDTGVEAEAFSRYIGGALEFINEGKTYSVKRGSTPTWRRSCRARPTPCSRARRCARSC